MPIKMDKGNIGPAALQVCKVRIFDPVGMLKGSSRILAVERDSYLPLIAHQRTILVGG